MLYVSDTKELRVLVDLAYSSAREDAMEYERIACLDAVGESFSSLIYGLSPQTTFKEFLDKCKLVWKFLESDPGLQKKLVRRCEYFLQWNLHCREIPLEHCSFTPGATFLMR